MTQHPGMMKRMAHRHVHALALALALLGNTRAAMPQTDAHQAAAPPSSTVELAEDAYIWAYPLLQNYQTMHRMLVQGKYKLNEITHRRELLDPSFKTIIGPNNDTLYSSVWLDLRNGPVTITVPAVSDKRYWSIQFIDLLVHNFAYVGSRTTGFDGGTYAIVGPSHRDTPVTGVDAVFHSESEFVFAILRILTDDPQDARVVNALQDQFRVSAPLPAAHSGIAYPAFDAAAMETHEFVEVLNFLLRFIDLHPDDLAHVRRYAAIGIGPGGIAPSAASDPATVAAIDEGVKRAMEKIKAKTKAIGTVVEGWSTTAEGFGSRELIAGNLLAKAAAARIGLYGNSREENFSWVTHADLHARPLDGSTTGYTIRFAPGQLPPAQAFWSVTLYEVPAGVLHANPIQRYSIGDRTPGLRRDRDGALTLYIQHEQPEADKLANWLPAPPGPFALALRMYLPATDAAAKAWHPPGLEPIAR